MTKYYRSFRRCIEKSPLSLYIYAMLQTYNIAEKNFAHFFSTLLRGEGSKNNNLYK